MKKRIMTLIIMKCGTTANFVNNLERYASEFGEEKRDEFVDLLWDTVHTIST